MDNVFVHPTDDYGEQELEALLTRAADGDPEANEVLQRVSEKALREIAQG